MPPIHRKFLASWLTYPPCLAPRSSIFSLDKVVFQNSTVHKWPSIPNVWFILNIVSFPLECMFRPHRRTILLIHIALIPFIAFMYNTSVTNKEVTKCYTWEPVDLMHVLQFFLFLSHKISLILYMQWPIMTSCLQVSKSPTKLVLFFMTPPWLQEWIKTIITKLTTKIGWIPMRSRNHGRSRPRRAQRM